jgi:multidrug efflux pump subunit AcrA (membrane-fusion protein)
MTSPGIHLEISPDAATWETFLRADSSGARFQAWLALVCAQLRGVQMAVVLVEEPSGQHFAPVAAWPQASLEMGRLGPAIEAALRERHSVTRSSAPQAACIAWPLMIETQVAGMVALEIDTTAQDVDAASRVIYWGSAWLLDLLRERARLDALSARERLGSVLEATAVLLRHTRLRQALFEVVHVLRQHFGCARVAIGLAEEMTVTLTALSDAATFEKRSPLVLAFEQAMNEALDAHAVIRSPVPSMPEEASGSAPKHDALRALANAGSVLSFPLSIGTRCVGLLTLTQAREQVFSEEDMVWLDGFGALASPIIAQRQMAESGAFRRLYRDLRGVLARLFGPRHLTLKAVTASVVLLAAVLILTPVDYRVSAKTVIEGEVQRVVAAPFEGFLGAAHARAGDAVKAEQLLAQLDDRELRIEEARWSSERDQYENRLREAMANHDLVAIQVLEAQLRQAASQLALVTEKIARSKLIAPFDGLVISGDLSQQIGAPVEMGQKLFEIAPLASYRVILQVDEREIRHVRIGQSGRLVMTGIAGEPMDFAVAKVTPVATARDGANFFRVEAALSDASPRLRPGMEGVGKIEVGRRSLWWVLTHGFTDWLRLTLWAWLP